MTMTQARLITAVLVTGLQRNRTKRGGYIHREREKYKLIET